MIVVFVLPYAAIAEDDALVQKSFVYDAKGKRDPFWPLVSETGSVITYDEQELSSSDMMLTGMLTGSDGKNIAVINGKIVKEGDMIGAFKVEKILTTAVVLDNGKEKSELYLQKEE